MRIPRKAAILAAVVFGGGFVVLEHLDVDSISYALVSAAGVVSAFVIILVLRNARQKAGRNS